MSSAKPKPLASDTNGDGFAELITGMPGRDVNGAANAGAFAVVPGRASGAKGAAKVYTQDTPGFADVAEKDDNLGFEQTSGDFNGDGYADAAVSAPGENGTGAVSVAYGSPTGLNAQGSQILRRGLKIFGASVAALDVNRDGYADLAVGATGRGAKAVVLYFGGPQGLQPGSAAVFRPGSKGIPGRVRNPESFGFELKAGDFNGDGFPDLAVGDPYDWSAKYGTYGSVTVLYGKPGKGPSYRFRFAQRWDKDSPGIAGTVGRWKKDEPDYFGWSLAAGDFNRDGRADLAIGAPGSPVKRKGKKVEDAGTINVIYGSKKGLRAAGNRQFTLQTKGVPGTVKAGDSLGISVAAADADGDRDADLAVGAWTRQFVVLLRGARPALTVKGSRWITQRTPKVPGNTRKGGCFGCFLSFVNLRGARFADLAVGDPFAGGRRGTVTVLPKGLPAGAYLVALPTASGDQGGVLSAIPYGQGGPYGQGEPFSAVAPR